MCYDKRGVENGVVTEGQALSSSDHDKSRIDDTLINSNNVSSVVVQRLPQQQPPQGPVIRWERFLPVGSPKVLLVENDDSTRQIVSALLRNCSYEVTAVSNGLQAWRILEDVNNRVDLVLTEAVMRDPDAKSSIQESERKDGDTMNGPSGISQGTAEAFFTDPEDLPSLELSLTRPRHMGDSRSNDRNVLRRSDLSAFSKYNTASSANKRFPRLSSAATKTGSQCNFPSHSSITPLNQPSNVSRRNNDMSSTVVCANPNPDACNKSSSMSAFKPFHSSAVQLMQNGHISSSQPIFPEKTDDLETDTFQPHMGCSDQPDHFPSHHNSNMLMKDVLPDAPPSALLNMFEGTAGGMAVNCSVTRSASGSNHGSNNGHSGNGNATNTKQANGKSDNAAGGSGKSRPGASNTGNAGGDGADYSRVAQREAALIKFHQKRKERCFETREEEICGSNASCQGAIRQGRFQIRKRVSYQRRCVGRQLP